MLVQPTTIAQAQAAGSPYFWDNGKKKLAVTAEQLAAFKGGAQYDPAGGSALTQWANIQNQPQMDLQPVLDIPRQEPGMMDRVRGFVGGLIPEGRTKSGVVDPSEDWVDKTVNWGRKYLPNILVPDEPYTSAIGELTVNQQRARSPARPVREGRVAPVSYSQVAVDKIADWEGFRDKPYMDAGSLRIGYGRKAKKGETTSSDKERGNLMTKVQDIGDWLDGVVTADLNANQKAALTSLVYNVGQGSFKKSKALKALNAGDMDEFRKQAFSKEQGWVKSKGKFVKGLHNRRQKEQALFFG